jgi:hypothetical protein
MMSQMICGLLDAFTENYSKDTLYFLEIMI